MATTHFTPVEGCLLITDGRMLHGFHSGAPVTSMPVAGVRSVRLDRSRLEIHNAYTDDLVVELDAARAEAAQAFGERLLSLAERCAAIG